MQPDRPKPPVVDLDPRDRQSAASKPYRTAEQNWPIVAVCIIGTTFVLAGIHWLQHGISAEFGLGVSCGLIVGILLTSLALGWRKQGTD